MGKPVLGHAWGMGSATDELQYQQARAEEKPTGCVGCPELVRPFQQGGEGFQVHDHHKDGW